MKFYSLNRQAPLVDFETATVLGQAPDKGLYFPEYIPQFAYTVQQLKVLPADELAWQVMQPYAGDCIPEVELRRIAAESISFPFPLVKLTNRISTLELFHGPTLAFKDVGARFMSRCLGYFNRHNSRLVTVLVATSGDTGGAVANGFEGVEGVEVIILYPSGKVSPVQELQLTTCGHNITALEVNGVFDDCQAMVKQAFMDADLTGRYQLTSANSINVARWLPQQLYYLLAWQQWQYDMPPVICVPSGNFGNICAGMLAAKSGMPAHHFIAACNANDVIPHYLLTGLMKQQVAIATISNAMDVALPSNFVRILEMYDNNKVALRANLSGASITDDATRQTIKRVYTETGYTLDPHGAVGYLALHQYLQAIPGTKGYFLETAHPVKFPEVVEQMTGKAPGVPEIVKPLLLKEKRSIRLAASYDAFKQWILAR
jgi:threonine synthase